MRMGEKWVANGIVAVVVALNAIVLAPDATIARIDVNDNVFHYTIADAVVQRVAHGRSALDFWMPEWSCGYPVLRVYQPLGAWLAAAVQIATGQHFPLDATFAVLRWLLIAAFPLSVYRSCRLMNFPRMTAAAAAVVSPLIASPNLYGLEYGSYLWRGNGLYTQLVAMHLFVLATGAGGRAIRRGKGITLTGLLVALTFLAHLIYGYMAALSVVLIVFLPDAQSTWRKRFVRLVWIGALSFGLTAFHLLPMLRDGAFINRSHWEPAWKWESFGLKQAAVLVATGELLDSQRLPVIAVLALIGAIYAFGRRHRVDEEGFPHRFAIAAAVLWFFMFCGSATWGSLFTVLGIGDEVQTHRFIGGLHWFLIILAGIGLDRLWSLPQRHAWRFATVGALAITAALLAFPVAERLAFVAEDVQWGRDNLAAYDEHRRDIDKTISFVKSRGGRAYPGLAATWGNQFKIGYVPFYSFLSRSHIPAVAFLYHAMALPADVMVRFDETRPEQYRLFDIGSVIADGSHVVPSFLAPAGAIGSFRLFKAPPSSAFDLVDVPFSVYADRRTFYDVSDGWLQSAAVGARQHLLIDYESTAAKPAIVRLPDTATLARATAPRPLGSIVREEGDGDVWSTTVEATTNCFLLFKSTYHPNWRAQIDGAPAPVVMLTPGFAAVRISSGRHDVQFRYDHGVAKPLLFALAFPLLLVSFIGERRGLLARAEEAAVSRPLPSFFTRHRFALLLAVLMLPCIAPLLGRALTSGHDALEYVPRLVEFHENITHGILLPRWAPDLSSGQGQPLFLLNPPLFYYVADLWHFAGAGFPRAINLAVLTMIIGSAVSMFFLGRYWFGPRGGLLSALAYVYAPYFLVDLYVRAAFAELSAFPFYPIAFYGFARYADDRRLRSLLIGCLGYAAVWFAHTPSAVLFSPLLGAYLVFLAWKNRSLKLLAIEAAAVVLALAFAAAIWVPGVTEASDTNSHRLTEGPLRYSNHFVYPRQLFGVGWGYGVSVPGDQDGMPFNLGWTHLLIAAAAALIVYRRDSGARKAWFIFFAAATFAICYLVTPRAHTVWDRLPQLHYVAFPWRLLADSAFCLALLVGAAVWAIEHIPAPWRTATFAALVAIVFLGNVPHARPSSYLSIDPAQWTPHQIAERNVIAATFDTFEPRWVGTRPVYDGQRIAVNRGSATISVEQRTPERLVASIRAAGDADLELPIAYFPGWHVTVDGNEVPVDAPSAMGRMRLPLPAGSHRIEAHFRRTPVRAAADVTSMLALLLIAALLYLDARRQHV